ncbi:hypothetical protein ACJMK2_002144 [Sinanodonta woodiana]|uniref:Protein sleepless n=1 Tax=Sinanodonta woodiana TaxID=1069815 RepID=A0ABD3XW80_SINWO
MCILEIKFLVILGILIGLKRANAVTCYKCDLLDKMCYDPFKKTGDKIAKCYPGSCYKFKSSSVTRRGCQTKNETKYECANDVFDGVSGLLCSCKENLCNNALPVGSSITIMAAAMINNIFLR